MELWLPFVQGFLFSLSLCFDLGIVNVAIIKTGMERGFKPSFMIGFGSCFGDLFYLSLALLGVSVVFEIAVIKWLFWIIGSGVLFYFTYKMFRETWRPRELPMDAAISAERSLFRDWLAGAGLAVSSPTVIAWFAFAAGTLLATFDLSDRSALLVFIAGFFTAGLLWSLGVALASSLSGAFFKEKIVRVLSFVSAMLFLYFAIKVFWDGLRDVIG
ncbi:LysE family translocator [Paenibacillus sp. YIM B09110]|uniref:LysE family translocator n=1 Tax=Paenibacillus sp. YIM B09110 TaxID=3126102 RepID=UPI00301D0231